MTVRRAARYALAMFFLAGGGTADTYAGGGGLVAWYTFDDGTATDQSGNGHDGTLFGNPQPVPGIVEVALRFDGVDGGIGVPPSNDFLSPSFTVSLWCRIAEETDTNAVLLEKMLDGTGYTVQMDGETGALVFSMTEEGGDGIQIASPFPIMPGVWTAVTASYDEQFARLFVHGELVAEVFLPGLNVGNDGPLRIALGNDGPAFPGAVDEVRIFNFATNSIEACQEALKLWEPISATCVGRVLDMTAQLGLGDEEHDHFAIAHSDVNNDGWVDLYYANGTSNPDVPQTPSGVCPKFDGVPPFDPANVNVMYMNNGDGTFTPDVAPQVGLDDFWNAMRHVWIDYDNDGLRDLHSHNFLVTSLYRQVSSDPLLFEDVTEQSGLTICLKSGTGASWADLNSDGFLDVIAVEYAAGRPASAHVNQVWLNNGDGTFENVTDQTGDITLPNNPMGIAGADFDNDGDQDFFFANSHEAPSRLLRHDGVNFDGVPQFTDIAQKAGVAVVGEPDRGFGGAWGDFNNDGLLDLIFIREADSRVYRNDGPDGQGVWRFTDITGVGGLDLAGLTFHDGAFFDLDNDGWLDIMFTNVGDPSPNRVFLSNGGDGTWRQVAELTGLDLPTFNQRGVVPLDIDNDGDLDLSLMSRELGEPNFLFLNDTRGNNWIQFNLIGATSNRDAIGARIELTAQLEPNGPAITQIREVIGGTGFFSDFPKLQTMGLGKATQVLEARILWPNGITQELGSLEVNSRHTVVEPVVELPGDLDGDGVVGSLDLLLLLGAWGPCDNCFDCPADLNDDCVVGTSDLLLLLGNWS